MLLFSNSFKRVVIVSCFFLLASFVLHDAIHHEHNEAIYGTDCFTAALHQSDRQWPLLLILAFLAFAFFLTNSIVRLTLPALIVCGDVASYAPRDPPRQLYTELFSRGLLHPKMCG